MKSTILFLPALLSFLQLKPVATAEPAHIAPIEQPLGEIVGSTHVGGKYALTSKPFLKEGADRIMEMGSRTIKLWLNRSPGSNYPYNSNWGQYLLSISSVTDLIQTPYYREVLDLPFSTVVLMTTEFAYPNWKNGLNNTEASFVREELQELTEYLLTEYRDSGKTFIISNWESDNNLNFDSVPSTSWPTYIQGMIDWTNARMDGIIAGRNTVTPQGVQVFGAFEVNQIPVNKSFDWPVAVDVVVPHTYCDLYSYSNWGTKIPGEEWQIVDNLDYIAAKSPPSAAFGERNVYLGEWGAYEVSYMTALNPASSQDTRIHDAESDRQHQDVIMKNLKYALRWGVHYALYWQVYCNGLRSGVSVPLGQMAKEEQLRGVWLIRPSSNLHDLPYSYTSTWGSLAELMTENRLFDGLKSADAMAYASPNLRFTSSVQAWAPDEVSRIAPAVEGGENEVRYFVQETLRDFHVDVYDANPYTLADKLSIEISANGSTWQPVPFAVEFVRQFSSSSVSRAYLRPVSSLPPKGRHFRIRWLNASGDFPQLGNIGLFTGDIATIEDKQIQFADLDMTSGNWQVVFGGPENSIPLIGRTNSDTGWIVHRANAIRSIAHTLLHVGNGSPIINYSASYDGNSWSSIGAQPAESLSIGGDWNRTVYKPANLPIGTRYIRFEVTASDPHQVLLETYSIQHSPKQISIDSDNDGWMDIEENWLATDPGNPADRFGITSVSIDLNGFHMSFPSRAGTRYRIQRLTDNDSMQWKELMITEAQGDFTTVTDPLAAEFPITLYRIKLAPW